jgi:redox-sensing transcriptional repressor
VLDNDPELIGTSLGPESSLLIRAIDDLETVAAANNVLLGIVCVPAKVAQKVVDRLVAAGVKGILNFAPVALSAPKGVAVRGVDLAVQLEQLSFQVSGVLEEERS